MLCLYGVICFEQAVIAGIVLPAEHEVSAVDG